MLFVNKALKRVNKEKMAISLYDDKCKINALFDSIRQSRSRAEASYLLGVASWFSPSVSKISSRLQGPT